VVGTGRIDTGYRLEAGRGPGLSDVAMVILGPVPQSTATDVPAETYYVRVRAIDADGIGAASNEVVVHAHQWSFSIAPADLREGPLPEWAFTAWPPTFGPPK